MINLRPTPMLLILCVIPVLFAACSSDSTGGVTPERSPSAIEPTFTPSQSDSVGASASVYRDLLELIPDTPENRALVYLNNNLIAGELAGIEPPSAGASAEEVLEYVSKIRTINFSPFLIGPGQFIGGSGDYSVQFAENRDYRSYDQRDVAGGATIGTGTNQIELIVGVFAIEEFDLKVQCAECPPVDTVKYASRNWYSWGDGGLGSLSLRFAPPVFDQIGRSGEWLVRPNSIVRTFTSQNAEQISETADGNQRSLADIASYVALADAMAELQVFNMVITDEIFEKTPDTYIPSAGFGFTHEQWDRLVERIGVVPSLVKYSALSLGVGVDDKGPFNAVAIYHDSNADAEENAERLKEVIAQTVLLARNRRWADLFVEIETTVHGNVMTAKLREDDDVDEWLRYLNDQEIGLFAYESPWATSQYVGSSDLHMAEVLATAYAELR